MNKKLSTVNQITVYDVWLAGGLENDPKDKPVRLARKRTLKQAQAVIDERLGIWSRILGSTAKERVYIKQAVIPVSVSVKETKYFNKVEVEE